MTFEIETFEFKSQVKSTIVVPLNRIKELTKDIPFCQKQALEGHIGPLCGFKVVAEIWCSPNRGYVFDKDGNMKLVLVFD